MTNFIHKDLPFFKKYEKKIDSKVWYFFHTYQFYQDNHWFYVQICYLEYDLNEDGLPLKALDHAGGKC